MTAIGQLICTGNRIFDPKESEFEIVGSENGATFFI